MKETTTNKPVGTFDFPRVITTLLRPRQSFESQSTWLTPMIILSVTALLVVIVVGYLKTQAALMGEIPLPPDWQYWSPEMQNNYMQAQQATQGAVFMYVIPLVSSLSGLWIGWVILGGILHLISTFMGGRGTMQTALNTVGWSNLPFALRDALQIIYMLSASHIINSPGLSGFAVSPFFVQILSRTDIFFIWSAILLIIGFSTTDGLPRLKTTLAVLAVIIIFLLIQAGVATALASLTGAVVQRPF